MGVSRLGGFPMGYTWACLREREREREKGDSVMGARTADFADVVKRSKAQGIVCAN